MSIQHSGQTYVDTQTGFFSTSWANQTAPYLKRHSLPQLNQNSDPELIEAVNLYNQNLFIDSINKLNDFISTNQNNILAYHYRGLSYLKQAETQPMVIRNEERTIPTCCGLWSRRRMVSVNDPEETRIRRENAIKGALSNLEFAFSNLSNSAQPNNKILSSLALSIASTYYTGLDEGGTRAYISRAVELDPNNMEARKAKELHDKPTFNTYVEVQTRTTAIATAQASATAQARAEASSKSSAQMNFY